MIRVWWVQCKPFESEKRNSKESYDFQNECLEKGFFGMGWKSQIFNKYAEAEISLEISEKIKKIVNNRKFTQAQNLYGEMQVGDVVLTRLNDIYYVGTISFIPRMSKTDRLTWYSNVKDGWIKIGNSCELPHHIRGKISSKKYHGTVAEIDGLAAQTIMSLAGVKCTDRLTLKEDDFFWALGDEDLEDLVAHYMTLKTSGYVFLPSSCKKSTPGVEYVMYSPSTTKMVTCQTKVNQKIDVGMYLNDSFYRKYETIFLFSGAGYINDDDNNRLNIEIIKNNELYNVLKNNMYFVNMISNYFDLS